MPAEPTPTPTPIGAIRLIIDDVEVPAGADFVIPFRVEDPGGFEVAAFDLDISYDPAVIQISDLLLQDEETATGWALIGNPDADPGIMLVIGFTSGNLESGSYILFKIVATAIGDPGTSTDLSVCWIEDFTDGDIDIPVQGFLESKGDCESNPTTSVTGRITITQP